MNDVVLSVSGGMDSTGLLVRLLSEGRKVDALSFFYGQKHSVELERIKANLSYFKERGINVEHHVIDLSSIMGSFYSALTDPTYKVPEGHYADENMKQTVVPNRNAIFSSIIYGFALSLSTKRNTDIDIALGVHSGDHCFSRDTKVLTKEGLKSIEELKEGEPIFSFNLDTNRWEEDKIKRIVKKNVVEKINVITTRAGTLKVTDEHKVYKLKVSEFDRTWGYKKSIEKVPVRDLTEDDFLIQATGIHPEDTAIDTIDLLPIAREILKKYKEKPLTLNEENGYIWLGGESDKYKSNKIPRVIDAESFTNIMAWYIAEGWSQKNPYTMEGANSRYSATFSQSLKANLEKVDLIIRDLNKADIKSKYEFSKTTHNSIPKEVIFYISNICSIFMKECGSHSSIKKVPEWLMSLLRKSSALRESFLFTIGLADGFDTETPYRGFCSTSDKLIEQMIELIQLSGYHFSLNNSKKTRYIIYSSLGRKEALVSLGQAKFTEILSITSEEYNDHVYDIEVEKNHNFLAGEYGSLLISNSIYPDCRPEFYDAIYKAFSIGNWGAERVNYYLPYINEKKEFILRDSIKNCKNLELDFNTIFKNTNTCYKPNEQGEACGKCGSCTERLEAFKELGIKDPVTYVE